MRKKIALVGLRNFKNMGDQILCESVAYLFGQYREECELHFVDQCPPLRIRDLTKWNYYPYFFYRLFEKPLQSRKNSCLHLERKAWHWRLKGHYEHALAGMDAVVIVGGTIKFSNQGVNYAYEKAVQTAESLNIPVMFNAMSVEQYDPYDERCGSLQTFLNKNCVKIITTRDGAWGIKQLKKYIYNKGVTIAAVGDSAFWIPECYDMKKSGHGPFLADIGIGVIRGDIYERYGMHITPQKLMNTYMEMIEEAEKRHYSWKLFSNGLDQDQEFAVKLLKKLGKDAAYLVSQPQNAAELIRMVGGFRGVIAARMHACIIAYALDIPMVGLVWDEKIRQFGKTAHCSGCLIEKELLNGKQIMDEYEAVRRSNYDEKRREQLRAETKKYIEEFIHAIFEEAP